MRAVLFDFDGTITDSEAVMLEVMNELADEFGFKKLVPEELGALRKLSLREFVRTRLEIPLWQLMKLRRLERRSKRLFEEKSGELHVFEGMPEVIKRLREQGYFTGVVSSSPAPVVARVLAGAGIAMDVVSAGTRSSGKARAIQRALRDNRLDPGSTVYVGDELRDVEAAERAGIRMIGVSWGLNDAASLREGCVAVASTPEELLRTIEEYV